MENSGVFIPTENKFRKIIESTVDAVIQQRIPELMRRSDRKEWLTTKDFKELFGVSYRLQKHYRDECGLTYHQEGKKIFYKTVDVENFMDDRAVNK